MACAVLAAGALAAQAGSSKKPPLREHGYGLVAFRGHGPEEWAARYRAVRELAAARADGLVGLVLAFLCIHAREAESWSTNTGNGFYGGLQFDMSFQRTYGPDLLREKGTADHWTAGEQIAVAIAAHAERGFWPWPNTARACGLL
jgi:Transglycosylase-like domain